MTRGGEKDVKEKTRELGQKRWRAFPRQSRALGQWGGAQKNLGNMEMNLESSLLQLLLFLHFPLKFQETLHEGREVQEWGSLLATSPPGPQLSLQGAGMLGHSPSKRQVDISIMMRTNCPNRILFEDV